VLAGRISDPRLRISPLASFFHLSTTMIQTYYRPGWFTPGAEPTGRYRYCSFFPITLFPPPYFLFSRRLHISAVATFFIRPRSFFRTPPSAFPLLQRGKLEEPEIACIRARPPPRSQPLRGHPFAVLNLKFPSVFLGTTGPPPNLASDVESFELLLGWGNLLWDVTDLPSTFCIFARPCRSSPIALLEPCRFQTR